MKTSSASRLYTNEAKSRCLHTSVNRGTESPFESEYIEKPSSNPSVVLSPFKIEEYMKSITTSSPESCDDTF